MLYFSFIGVLGQWNWTYLNFTVVIGSVFLLVLLLLMLGGYNWFFVNPLVTVVVKHNFQISVAHFKKIWYWLLCNTFCSPLMTLITQGWDNWYNWYNIIDRIYCFAKPKSSRSITAYLKSQLSAVTNKQKNRQTTKQPNNRTNKQTNKQPNKQTNKHIAGSIYFISPVRIFSAEIGNHKRRALGRKITCLLVMWRLNLII